MFSLKKISLIYPYGFLPPHGTNLRARLLLQYLAQRGHEIDVLAFESSEEIDEPGLRIRVHQPGLRPDFDSDSDFAARRLAVRLLWLRRLEDGCAGLSRDAVSVMEFELVSRFYAHYLDANFQHSLRETIANADVVLLDEPFFMRHLAPLARAAGVPVILTDQGAYAATYCENRAIKRLLLREELRAAKSADAFCSVSPREADFFRSFGIETTTIINPIDAHEWLTDEVMERRQSLLDRFDFLREPFCFFVGGSHFPNVDAVGALHEMSKRLPAVRFVIAGTCAPKRENDNLYQLGVVSEEGLHALYMLAGIVVIPLRSGSGTSLKAVEAMAHGAAILSTAIGCRGYALEHGVHAMIHENFEEYPQLIEQLLADAAARERLGKNARALASQYHYREVFAAYDALMERIVMG